jgi:DNA repair exonuclease SbcCD nuclease subunit
MKRKYYSSRKGDKKLTTEQLYERLKDTYLYFKEGDYFKEQLEITHKGVSDRAKYLSSISLHEQVFPVGNWDPVDMVTNKELIFSTIEFLYDYISKPGELEHFTDNGFNYTDYGHYDTVAAQNEFRSAVNSFMDDYNEGYQLDENGEISKKGEGGLEHILTANIVEYDFDNIDLRVKKAIHTWKSRSADLDDKKRAIQELADVFEWLRKNSDLKKALNKKDENALFQIANQFAIRHHNPNQKSDYDEKIWYSWIFHFYLASYHAIIRILKKVENQNAGK